MKTFNSVTLVLAGIIFFLGGTTTAHAESKKQQTKEFSSSSCGLTVVALSQITSIAMTSVPNTLIDAFFTADKQLERLSDVCEFEVVQKKEYTNTVPLVLKMAHTKTALRPHLYYWQSQKKVWVPLPTVMNRDTLVAQADIHLAYAVVAVFFDKTESYDGTGSWYADRRHPMGAATNLFPTGTKVRVTNMENNKSTDVTITSTWTQTDPGRVIDLVSTAFKKIARLGAGLIPVRIEKL